MAEAAAAHVELAPCRDGGILPLCERGETVGEFSVVEKADDVVVAGVVAHEGASDLVLLVEFGCCAEPDEAAMLLEGCVVEWLGGEIGVGALPTAVGREVVKERAGVFREMRHGGKFWQDHYDAFPHAPASFLLFLFPV